MPWGLRYQIEELQRLIKTLIEAYDSGPGGSLAFHEIMEKLRKLI